MKLIRLFSNLSTGRLAIAAIVLTIAYYFMSFNDGSSVSDQIKAVNAEISIEKNRRIDIEKTMKKEEEMRGNLLQLARNLEVLKAKIPNEFKDTEMSSILNQASSRAAVKIGVLSRVTPVTVAKKVGSGAELIDEIVFEIGVTGTFSQLIHFVELLAKEEKAIKTRNFTIEKNSNHVDDNLLKFRGEVVGFKQASIVVPPPAQRGVKR